MLGDVACWIMCALGPVPPPPRQVLPGCGRMAWCRRSSPAMTRTMPRQLTWSGELGNCLLRGTAQVAG